MADRKLMIVDPSNKVIADVLTTILAGGTSLAIAQNGASDTVTLSAAQQSAVWEDLSKQATNQDAAGFDATIGTFVPDTVEIEPIPGDVTANNPSLKPYYFAMVDRKLVIVDPSNKVIADVLTTILAGGTSQAMAQNGASDTVTLSAAQRSAVWEDLSKQATNQDAAGSDATIGTFVPDTVEIEPIPGDVTANNPSLKPYYFAMVDRKLVIVDPSNKVIADVLTTILAGGTSQAMAQNGASDTVTLSATQRSAVWEDLSKQATNQDAAGFDATIGSFVPDTVEIEPIPGDVTANYPSLKPYYFAMVDRKLVIVDPSNKVIASVLTTIGHQLGHQRPATGEGRVGSVRTKRPMLSNQISRFWWLSLGQNETAKSKFQVRKGRQQVGMRVNLPRT
ncbi:MAG TPA: DUF1236 domain-containing protein [Xanthobacteraceae bacterium]